MTTTSDLAFGRELKSPCNRDPGGREVRGNRFLCVTLSVLALGTSIRVGTVGSKSITYSGSVSKGNSMSGTWKMQAVLPAASPWAAAPGRPASRPDDGRGRLWPFLAVYGPAFPPT